MELSKKEEIQNGKNHSEKEDYMSNKR